MIKEEIRLIISDAIEFISKTHEKLQDLNEQLSIEDINGKKSNNKPFHPKQMELIEAWTKIILKKKGELTFKLLFNLVQEKVSSKYKLTYPKLRVVLDKNPEFVKKTASGAKKMGRTPFVYSFVLKKGGKIT